MTAPVQVCTATQHGTRNAYNRYGCRCPEAHRANARKQAQYELRKLRGEGPRVIPSTGTVRRLQALVAIGYPLEHLRREVGMKHPYQLQQVLRRANVHVDTEAKVRSLYERLWNRPGPSDKARQMAAERGWLPPLWWDDDQIDNPDYDPRKDVVPLAVLRAERKAERIGQVVAKHRAGLSILEIARQMDLNPRQVSRDLADWRKEQGMDRTDLDRLAEEEEREHDGDCCHPEDLEGVRSA